MSGFSENFKYRKLKKRHFWHRQMYQFLAPFEYQTKSGKITRIETGEIIDFASVPWLFRWRYPAIGWYAKAVAIHDIDYKYGKSKGRADDTMVEGMEVLAHYLVGDTIPKEMQLTIDRFYRAVDRHGGGAWKKHRK